MKTMRYLLIVAMVSVASLAFATAQSLAQQPRAEMHSTSGMVYSGSTLPSAAASGTVTTGSKLGTYSPANGNGPHKAKRGASEEDGGDTPPPDPHGPMEDPLGDAAMPLMLLALAYMCARAFLKRRTRA